MNQKSRMCVSLSLLRALDETLIYCTLGGRRLLLRSPSVTPPSCFLFSSPFSLFTFFHLLVQSICCRLYLLRRSLGSDRRSGSYWSLSESGWLSRPWVLLRFFYRCMWDMGSDLYLRWWEWAFMVLHLLFSVGYPHSGLSLVWILACHLGIGFTFLDNFYPSRASSSESQTRFPGFGWIFLSLLLRWGRWCAWTLW